MPYSALDAQSAQVAALLKARGLAPGDRVGIMLPNVPAFVAAYYGALRAGGIVVPMNVLLKRREVAHYLGDSGARIVFAWSDFLPEAGPGAEGAGCDVIEVGVAGLAPLLEGVAPAQHVHDADDDDTAVILYTSGTTGTPKGAELRHGGLARNARACVDLFSLTDADTILGALPLFHSFGQTCGMNAAMAAGSCLTLLPRFDAAQVLEIIEREHVTVFEGVPTMYGALLHAPGRATADLSSLRVCASGGASLPVELLREFEAAFGCTVLEGYGLSETSPVASFNHPDRERKPGTIGTPLADVEMRLVAEDGSDTPPGEVGEIVIRGYNVMKGYWGKPDATAQTIRDGWLHTGDLARIDDDGYFSIVDRAKDLVIRGGYNVYPREVEEVLYEHPAVREAAVIGIPHDELGQEVAAAVALRDGATATPDELRDFLKSQVAAYKYPRHIWIVDDLPKTATGKILKREIAVPVKLSPHA